MTESANAVLVTAKLASDLQELTLKRPDLSAAAVRIHFFSHKRAYIGASPTVLGPSQETDRDSSAKLCHSADMRKETPCFKCVANSPLRLSEKLAG